MACKVLMKWVVISHTLMLLSLGYVTLDEVKLVLVKLLLFLSIYMIGMALWHPQTQLNTVGFCLEER